MLDVLKQTIRRGDHLIDDAGNKLMVLAINPRAMRLRDMTNGKLYTIRLPAFLKIPTVDPLATQQDRQRYFRARAPRDTMA